MTWIGAALIVLGAAVFILATVGRVRNRRRARPTACRNWLPSDED